MMPVVVIIVSFSVVIGLIVFIFRYTRQKNKEKNKLYNDLALRLNLEYTESKNFLVMLPHVSGQLNGSYVEIYEKIVGSGKNQTVYTNVHFHNSPHSFQFRIGKEHFFSKMGKKLGFNDIEFDNLELDKKILFKSMDEEQFRRLMDYKLLYALEGIADGLRGTIYNDNNLLTYSFAGVVNKTDKMTQLENVIKFMGSLAQKK